MNSLRHRFYMAAGLLIVFSAAAALWGSDRIRTGASFELVVLLALALVGLSLLLSTFIFLPLKRVVRNIQKLTPDELRQQSFSSLPGEIGRAFTYLRAQLNGEIENLASSRATMASALDYMSDCVLIVDREGLVQYMNPAALNLFLPNGDSQPHSLVEVVRHHQLVSLWQKSLDSKNQQTTTIETGEPRLFIQAIATPLAETLPGSTLLVLQDFTRVHHLETVRRDFVSNVSHELRTPLASLKALTETLTDGAIDDPEASPRFLKRMDHEIDNLIQMVEELLELSRIESGKVPLQRQSIPPYELVRKPIERMQLQAERARLKIQNNVSKDLPAVQADPSRISQVITNLLHNAIKFTQPGGEIRVAAYPEGYKLVFSIADTGVGIEPDALERIFERFYKADRARSGGGTGLGLSIARHIVELHEGKIWATSQIGKGSTFYFSLPVWEKEE